MTHEEVVESINKIRNRYKSVVNHLRDQTTIPSFRTLLQTAPRVKEAFERAKVVAENPRVAQKCAGTMNCAVIGSSSAGKTTMLEGMFPSLAKQGVLYADVTDTTSQALI